MTPLVRIALGIALGLALAALPFLHYGGLGGHRHAPAAEGGSHASHAH